MKTDPTETKRARFWSKVNVSNDDACWEWNGCRDDDGYGRICRVSYGQGFAHRYAWIVTNGGIPDGMQVDHLCKNRACVNPRHMEIVSLVENVRRGDNPAFLAYRTNMCVKGLHALEGENVIRRPDGRRKCRACELARRKARGWA